MTGSVESEDRAPRCVRVVSWNVRYGLAFERAAVELASSERLRTADIVLLQEMDERGTAHIAGQLSANYAFASAATHGHTGRDFGNAVIARWPIVDDEEIALPHRAPLSGQPRSATRAVVRVGDLDVVAYSVHTEIPLLRLARRIGQFDAIAADVAAAGHGWVIVGGDFNTVTTRSIGALTASMGTVGLRRVSAPGVPSYRRLGRDLVLDHVFASGFDVRSSGVVPSTSSSDHLPLWTELSRSDRSCARPAPERR